MAAEDTTRDSAGLGGRVGGFARRRATETKEAFKTTEFWAYVVVLIVMLICAQIISADDGGGNTDYFQADKAWLYATLLTIGYMVSRGLAKSGSREPYTADDDR